MAKKGVPFVLESGDVCVKIPNEVIKRNHKKWELFIIGQFHGNLPSHGALHVILNEIWSHKLCDITLSKLGPNTVLIKIPNVDMRKRVLSQGIWHIERQTMFVADWSLGLNLTMPELTKVPVWLEFRGVPPHFFSIEGLEHIVGILGDPKFPHPSTLNMTNLEVAKVFNIIDPTKLIPKAINVQCMWLPPTHFQEMGHSICRCPTAPITYSVCKSTDHSTETCPKAKKKKPLFMERRLLRFQKQVNLKCGDLRLPRLWFRFQHLRNQGKKR